MATASKNYIRVLRYLPGGSRYIESISIEEWEKLNAKNARDISKDTDDTIQSDTHIKLAKVVA